MFSGQFQLVIPDMVKSLAGAWAHENEQQLLCGQLLLARAHHPLYKKLGRQHSTTGTSKTNSILSVLFLSQYYPCLQQNGDLRDLPLCAPYSAYSHEACDGATAKSDSLFARRDLYSDYGGIHCVNTI